MQLPPVNKIIFSFLFEKNVYKVMELNLLKKFEVFNTEGGVPCPTAWEQFTF